MSIKIITISRQFGSGGRTIAKTLAQKLGYDYYDKEIIEQVAEKTGFSKEVVASKGEEAPGKSIFSYGFEAQATPGIMNGMTMNDYIWSVQRKVIKDIAESGKPVIDIIFYGFVCCGWECKGRLDTCGYAVFFALQEKFPHFVSLKERFSATQGYSTVFLEHFELRFYFFV